MGNGKTLIGHKRMSGNLLTRRPAFNASRSHSGIESNADVNRKNRWLSNFQTSNGLRGRLWSGGIQITGSAIAGSGCHRYRITKADANSIKVAFGQWTRNGTTVDLTTDVGEDFITIGSITATNETYTVYLELERATPNTKDPALIPDKLEAKVATAAAWAALQHSPANIYFRVGYVYTDGSGDISSIKQVWCLDIDDSATIPDTESALAGVAPYRSTLAWNLAGDEHEGETQLYDVENAPASSYSLPYFNAGADAGGGKGPAGVLAWAAIDRHLSGATQRSIEVDATAGVQVYDFRNPGTHAPDGGEMVMLRYGTGPVVKYTDWDGFLSGLSGYASGWATEILNVIIGVLDHHDLAATWGDYDDHFDGPYRYMLLDNPDGDTVPNMFTRNAGPNYLGNALYIGGHFYTDGGQIYYPAQGSPVKYLDFTTSPVQMNGSKPWRVIDATQATAANTGALQINGGLSAQKRSVFVTGANVVNILNTAIGLVTVTDGTKTAYLVDIAGNAGYFNQGNFNAAFGTASNAAVLASANCNCTICNAAYGGYFDHSSGQAVYLADGTNAILANRRIRTDAEGFYFSTIKVLGAQQSGLGATPPSRTAGATYGATEQTMLQEAHDKIRLLYGALKTHGMIAT